MQIAEMSSIAIPGLLRFHAQAACFTSLLADFSLGAEETICTASSLEMTSQTYGKIK